MTVFITADLHLGHAFVAKLRGFDSVDDHDQWVIDSINRKVARSDDLWILGDLSLQKVARYRDRLAEIRGRKRVVLGNHDTAHPMNRGWFNQSMQLAKEVEWVGTDATIRHAGVKFRLSHFPTFGDHTELDRFAQWRPRITDDEVLLHGHTHSAYVYSPAGLHCGLDAHGAPVRLDDLLFEAKHYHLTPNG